MDILISNQSNQPIYEQIYHQIQRQILEGSLSAGTEMPSIRALAKDLQVSVITTKKAYELLTSEGYIETVKAKGSYVAQIDREFIKDKGLTEIKKKIKELVLEAKRYDIQPSEFLELVKKEVEE